MDFTEKPDDGLEFVTEEATSEQAESTSAEPLHDFTAAEESALAPRIVTIEPEETRMAARSEVVEEIGSPAIAAESRVEEQAAAAEPEREDIESQEPPKAKPLPPIGTLGQRERPRPIAASYSLTAPGEQPGQLFLFPELTLTDENVSPDLRANTSTVVVKPHIHSGEAPKAEGKAEEEDRAWGFLQEAKSLARDLVFAVIAAVLMVWFVIQPVKVQGTSMLPELKDGERIFVNKFIYSFETIERGDVVVFWYPKDPEKSFIKRVIGLPGDDVRIEATHVYINGRLHPEPYLDPEHTRLPMQPMTVHVDEHHYFVMGDNRDASNDSRAWGQVPEKYIYGKAMFRYWPVEDIGPIGSEGTR